MLINTPPGDLTAGERGFGAVPGCEREFADGVVTALRYADALSCPRIHAMAGIVPAQADAEHRAQCRSTFVRNLRLAAREAAAQGVELTIEPINHRDMPGYFLTTQAEAHAIREEVGAENLKVQMDLYHAQIVEGDLSEKIHRWLPHIGHIQIAGVPGTPRARRRRDQLSRAVCAARRARLSRLGRLRIPSAARHTERIALDGKIGVAGGQ